MTKEEIKADVLDEKVRRARGMLRCASSYLLASGEFEACGGCGNSFICSVIQKIVNDDIERAYNSVR